MSDIPGPKVDKHSTGGVGDKVSIILAPLVASAGVIIPMISGRGLGYTGGTLDKLESIPGFRTEIRTDEFRRLLRINGVAIVETSADVAPLDRTLYALRDVTTNVDSLSLIKANIMSKKLSEGIQGLVLDVKTGSGAFTKSLDSARDLAQSMVKVGRSYGIEMVAVITDMSAPIGTTVGNALEVRESIDALRGRGPDDLMEVTLCLGAIMLQIAGIEQDQETGKLKLLHLIEDGSALFKFKEMIKSQGGNPLVLERPTLLPQSCITVEIDSKEGGYIYGMDAEAVGIAAMVLGAGRERADSVIDHSAGIILRKKLGDYVSEGEVLCEFCTNDEKAIEKARNIFINALTYREHPPEKRIMVKEVII